MSREERRGAAGAAGDDSGSGGSGAPGSGSGSWPGSGAATALLRLHMHTCTLACPVNIGAEQFKQRNTIVTGPGVAWLPPYNKITGAKFSS